MKLLKNLFEYLNAIFYSITKLDSKDRNELTKILKSTIYRLIVSDKSKHKDEMEIIEEIEEEDDEEWYPKKIDLNLLFWIIL